MGEYLLAGTALIAASVFGLVLGIIISSLVLLQKRVDLLEDKLETFEKLHDDLPHLPR